MDRAGTGIEGLDKLLGGGLPIPCALSLVGEVGSGKSVLARQLTWSMLQQGFACLYYCADESASDIKSNFQSFGWNTEPFVEKRQLQFADIFSSGVKLIGERLIDEPSKIVLSTYNLPELIVRGRNFAAAVGKLGFGQIFVVFDSLTPLFAMAERKEVFEFAQALKFATRFFKALGIAVLHSGVVDRQTEDTVRHLSDGVIEINFTNPQKTQRTLRVLKLPEANNTLVPVTITGKGITLHLPPV